MNSYFNKYHLIESSGIHPFKIRNIYQYGSRIYGTNRKDSDYDFIITAGNLLEHEEIKVQRGNCLLNIHIITPDKFKRDLDNHEMMNLECIFAPQYAKLMEKETINFTLNKKKLIKTVFGQSFASWKGAKHKLNEGDITRGLKSLFHSLRMLIFAEQILINNKIIDFSAANYLWNEIDESNEFEWKYFNDKYFLLKQELETKLKII